MTTYKEIPALAADFLEADDHYWITGRMDDGQGGFCAHGAIRACTPRKGDAEIVRALARAQGYPESWNDGQAGGEAEVVESLRQIDTSDDAIIAAFGPQGVHVVALIQAAANLTEDQAYQAAAVFDATTIFTIFNAAAAAPSTATTATADDATADATAYDATADAAYTNVAGRAAYTAGRAARAATRALAVRHLIGTHGFTQAHYDTLTRPLRLAGVTIHPDDADLTTSAAAGTHTKETDHE